MASELVTEDLVVLAGALMLAGLATLALIVYLLGRR